MTVDLVLTRVEHEQGQRALRPLCHLENPLGDVARFEREEVRDEFAVRLRGEGYSPRAEFPAQFLVVFDDAVVHQRNPFVEGEVRVGVFGAGRAVRRPARVSDARVRRRARQNVGKRIHPPSALIDRNPFPAESHARAVVTPVFECAQSVYQHFACRPFARISHNAAHKSS